MHGNFGGELALTIKLAAFEIRNHEVLRLEHAFVHASRSSEDPVFVEANREVAFARDDETAVIHPFPSDTNFAAVLLFAFFMGRPERVGGHCRCFFLARRAIRTISLPSAKKTNGPRETGNPGRTLSHQPH